MTKAIVPSVYVLAEADLARLLREAALIAYARQVRRPVDAAVAAGLARVRQWEREVSR